MKQNLICGMIAASVVSVSFPATASAWGKMGHRVGADIAQTYLSADAKNAITSILGVEGLPEASTWPDFMRSSPEDFWRGDSRTWHYVTIPKGEVYGDSPAPETGDAITALAGFQTVLRDPSADPHEKARALRFAVHIIGVDGPEKGWRAECKAERELEVTWHGLCERMAE